MSTLEHLLGTTGQQPEIMLIDRHPQYASSLFGQRLAENLTLPLIQVQHHEAHFLAVLEEHSPMRSKRSSSGIYLGWHRLWV